MPGENPASSIARSRIIQLPSKVPVDASDHVVLQRHAGFLRGFRILPPEVLGNVLRQSFDDGPCLALLLDLHLDLLLHLDGVDLWRPLVQRPEVLVDAHVGLGARIEHFRAYGRPGGVLHRISRTHRRERRGWRGWLRHRRRVRQGSAGDYQASCLLGFVSLWIRRARRCDCYWYRRGRRHRRRVGQSGGAARDIGTGDTMLAQCCCSGYVDVFGAGGRGCPNDLDRRSGALDAERTEASELGPDPTGESTRSPQHRQYSKSPPLHPRPPQVSPRSNGRFQSSVDDDCKPYRAATSRTARIIPGNSALTTATTAGAITITILSPSSCPRRAIQLATNSLANGRRAMMAGYRRKS